MYMKVKYVSDALKVFDEMPERGIASVNAVISGLLENGFRREGFRMFGEGRVSGFGMNSVTVASVLGGCEDIEGGMQMHSLALKSGFEMEVYVDTWVLKNGKEIHGHVIKAAADRDVFVSTSLIDMYMKCGLSLWARRIFDQFEPKPKDPVFWNVMISGYGKHGECESAIEIFDLLREEKEEYGLKPSSEHIGCMVDLLGRFGRLREAKEVIDEMSEPSSSVYSSLLGACKQHLDPVLGEEAAMKLAELEPENPAPFVILSSIYAALERWEDVESIRHVIDEKQLVKLPGVSLSG
ncbi:hypothetical protein AALP_AA5G016100 [Arabis alpina]|uniref:Pentatricopeptide repeat-containing protein n=1 Tax=Arabis alpina TaxID=50452 RepID=A0A087GUA8_ARAAL|nr:hypothetical protein AALP_AA5G016100 [Arabis alpina]